MRTSRIEPEHAERAPTQAALRMLRRGRQQLIQRTQVRTGNLFRTLYEYDELPASRALIMEREAVEWADRHVALIRESVRRRPDGTPREREGVAEERAMLRAQRLLLRGLLDSNSVTPATASLLTDYSALLSRLIDAADHDQRDYNDLLTALARHRALYRRACHDAQAYFTDGLATEPDN